MSIAMTGHLGLKQETTFGTEATPPAVFGEIKSEGISMKNNLIAPRYIGNARGVKRVKAGRITADGDITLDLTPEDLTGWILKGVFGPPTTTSLGGGAYQHVYEPQVDFELPSFTVQVDAEAQCFNWIGTKFSDLKISFTLDDLIEAVLTCVCQRVKEATAATPTYTELDPWTPFDVAITLNGAANTEFSDLNLTITNGMRPYSTLNNQRYASKILATTFDCTGSFTLYFEDADMMRRFWGDGSATEPQKCLDSNSLVIQATQSCDNGLIGGGYYYTLKIEIFKFYIESAPANLTNPDSYIEQTVTFVTKHDSSEGTVMRVTLINSQSGYPDP